MEAVLDRAWPAVHDNGSGAGGRDATATVSPLGVKIIRADGWNAWWTLDRCHLSSPDAVSVLVQHDGAPGETLTVSDAGFRAAFLAAGEERDRRSRESSITMRRTKAVSSSPRWPLALFALLGLLVAASVAAAVLFGLPWITRFAASRIPPEWEAKIGDATVEAIAPVGKRCLDPKRLEAVGAVLARLSAALPSPAPVFQLTLAKDPMVNALAAPGGRIIVFEGLLVAAKNSDELAGVLAHEISHLTLHHPEEALVRRASLWIAVSLIAGDSSGIDALLTAAGSLAALSYGRADEAAADRAGIALMVRARLDASAMVSFFETLGSEGDVPQGLTFLSTHPRTADRIKTLRALAAKPHARPLPIALAAPWSSFRTPCP